MFERISLLSSALDSLEFLLGFQCLGLRSLPPPE